MSRRARTPPQEPTLEARIAEANEAVARAEEAIRFRKGQLAEAETELTSLDGPAGWLTALLGRREAYRAEAAARVKALSSEILALRAKLIEARQKRAVLARDEASRDAARAERDAQIERFAERVRETHHPLRDDLLALETEIQAAHTVLEDYTEAFRACGGLIARAAEVNRKTAHARGLARADVVGLPGAQALGFLKVREIQEDVNTFPQAVRRFNDACAVVGLTPLQLEVGQLEQGWMHIFADNLWMDLQREGRLSDYAREIDDVREIARETSLFVSTRRKELLAAQEERIERRRTLLDEALG